MLLQGIPKPQRYFCELQHNHLRSYVDLSKSLCVNTWKLSSKLSVEQEYEFEGGDETSSTVAFTNKVTLIRDASSRTTFEFQNPRVALRWAQVCGDTLPPPPRHYVRCLLLRCASPTACGAVGSAQMFACIKLERDQVCSAHSDELVVRFNCC